MLDKETLPKHLAIIMDGNGRWAGNRGLSRIFGHIRGARVAKKIIQTCAQMKLENLTLFTFSTENWFRPQEEVSFLMRLLARRLKRDRKLLMENNIRFRCIGNLQQLPQYALTEVKRTIKETEGNTGMKLVFALSYGGRQEILNAVKLAAQEALSGHLNLEKLDEETFGKLLESSFLPDPDLIIRTSGETRLSNFYLWQSAYSEIFIDHTLWPDYTESDLRRALSEYTLRERRFGRTPSHHTGTQTDFPWGSNLQLTN